MRSFCCEQPNLSYIRKQSITFSDIGNGLHTFPKTIIKIKDYCLEISYFIVILLNVVFRVADKEKA